MRQPQRDLAAAVTTTRHRYRCGGHGEGDGRRTGGALRFPAGRAGFPAYSRWCQLLPLALRAGASLAASAAMHGAASAWPCSSRGDARGGGGCRRAASGCRAIGITAGKPARQGSLHPPAAAASRPETECCQAVISASVAVRAAAVAQPPACPSRAASLPPALPLLCHHHHRDVGLPSTITIAPTCRRPLTMMPPPSSHHHDAPARPLVPRSLLQVRVHAAGRGHLPRPHHWQGVQHHRGPRHAAPTQQGEEGEGDSQPGTRREPRGRQAR